MTIGQLITNINTYVNTNNNEDITGIILNGVLKNIANFANDEILATNLTVSNLQNVVNSKMKVWQGVDNPNITSPVGVSVGDIYLQEDAFSNIIDYFVYTNILPDKWQSIGSTDLAIGNNIATSTHKSILFVDDSGKLGEITNFQYDEVADSLTFMHNDIGLLLNSETEVDDGVFTNLNGIAKMAGGAPEVFVGIADLSIFDPLWGEGVYITSGNVILIDSISKMVFYSDSEIRLISDDVFLGGDNSFITIDDDIMFTNNGGEFKFYHQSDPIFGNYMMKLFKQDDTLTDSTTYLAGSGIDDATWDGYTIGQLFQAMINMGFLA